MKCKKNDNFRAYGSREKDKHLDLFKLTNYYITVMQNDHEYQRQKSIKS